MGLNLKNLLLKPGLTLKGVHRIFYDRFYLVCGETRHS
jgi:hypothetical protein